MNSIKERIGIIIAAIIVISVFAAMIFPVTATDTANLVLEHTELWTEPGGNDVVDIYATDLDGEGTNEIITIGSNALSFAELRIGHWNGEAYTLLKEADWQAFENQTAGRAVWCSDVDKDGVVEILTATQLFGLEDWELRIWNWDSASNALNLEGSFGLFEDPVHLWEAENVFDIAAMDVDSDEEVEIVAAGSARFLGSEYGLIRILVWNGSAVHDEHIETWLVDTNSTTAYGVALGDVDGDDSIEIVTAGTSTDMIDLRVWQWNGSVMTLEISTLWATLDQSTASGLAIGDMNGDKLLEMVTAGRAMSSELPHPFFGLITVWEWDGVTLDLMADDAWQSTRGNVEFFAAAVEDVDLDGLEDAIVAGAVHETPGSNVFRVYSWDAGDITIKYSEEWIGPDMTSSFDYTTYSCDVDGDGSVEILTGGRGVDQSYSDNGEIDIWGFKFEPVATLTPLGLIALVIALSTIAALSLKMRKRR
jgi:hypothetical protein